MKSVRKILTHEGFRKYLENTAWPFCEYILRFIGGFFVGAWVTRYLGPENFGVLSYSLVFVSFFSSLAKVGLDGIVVRNIVKEPDKKYIYLGTAFWLKFIAGGLSFFIILSILPFTNNDTQTNIFIIIISFCLFFQPFDVIDFYFQSQVLRKFVSIPQIIQFLILSFLKIYLILINAELLWFVIIHLVDSIMLSIGFFIVYRKHSLFEKNFFKYFSFQTARNLIKDSWPFILSSFSIMIYMRIDQIMIQKMLDNQSVGYYAAAVKISEVWHFIPMIICKSLFPAIINAKKVGEELYYKRLKNLYKLMTFLGIFIALPTVFLSDFLIDLLYGHKYSQATDILMIHIWTVVLVCIDWVTSNIIIVNNKQINFLVATSLGAISNIVLNLFLIPYYGVKGAAVSALISHIISSFIAPLFFKIDKRYPFIVVKALITR